jgi:hypothetical protein
VISQDSGMSSFCFYGDPVVIPMCSGDLGILLVGYHKERLRLGGNEDRAVKVQFC